MTFCFEEPSHTFSEYLLISGYSSTQCIPPQVSLKTSLIKYKKGTKPDITISIPMVSAIMQSVSDDRITIALTQEDEIPSIYGFQTIEKRTEMIHRVKRYRAGFAVNDSNVPSDMMLMDVLVITGETGHSTITVTADGGPNGKLLGIITDKNYRISRMRPDTRVKDFIATLENLVYADRPTTLKGANDIVQEHKIDCLLLVNRNQELVYLVSRKGYDTHKKNENELIDGSKRYMVGAGINTRDYAERVLALLGVGADVLCIDSSEGFSEWQKITTDYTRRNCGDSVKVGTGNVVDGNGLRFLAEAGADFVKVGIGGGAICITREQKRIGRGQATALVGVAKARGEYYEETDVYMPICLDGGIVHDYHITLALTMDADPIMLGRYFARFDENPTKRTNVNGSYMKGYWDESSAGARNWQRYDMGGGKKLSFEEGVDSSVPYTGGPKNGVDLTLSKMCSTICNCRALTIPELREKAEITLVSSTSIVEGGAHDVILRDRR